MKFQKSFYTFVNTAIRILLVLIVSGLLLQSLFSTSFIGVVTSEAGIGMERTRNIVDDPWRHLLVFAVFTAVGIDPSDCEKADKPSGTADTGIR